MIELTKDRCSAKAEDPADAPFPRRARLAQTVEKFADLIAILVARDCDQRQQGDDGIFQSREPYHDSCPFFPFYGW